MKYEKLIFIYPFPIGSFLNAKVGLEAVLEEGDDYLDCFHKIRKDAKLMADIEAGKVYDAPPIAKYIQDEPSQYAQPKEEDIGVTPETILSCKDLKILQTYRFIKDTKPELKRAYEMKLDELSNHKK